MKFIKIIDRNIHLTILLTLLFFSLGGSLAHYFGEEVRLVEFIAGLFWGVSTLITANGLIIVKNNEFEFFKDKANNKLEEKDRFRFLILVLFFVGLVFLTIMVIGKTQKLFLWMLILLSYALLIIIPTLLNNGKLIMPTLIVIFQGSLVPAIAYNLFASGFHRSLTLMVFPLTMILLAVNISLEFSSYARDEIINRKTIIRMIGWQRGIFLHHFLLILSITLLIMNIGQGLPSKLFIPTLLTCPLIILDIYWLQRIKAGFRPIWPFFNALSISIVCVIVYLFAYTLWIN